MYQHTPAPLLFVVWFMLRHGHTAAEPARSAFVGWLLSFADLDDPLRQELAAAFAPGGTRDERRRAAVTLARAGLLAREDYRHALKRAADGPIPYVESAAG